jgi:hypothetical protein
MKKILLTVALVGMCAGAFAQGKIGMINDSTRLIFFENTLLADAALDGQKVPLGGVIPSGKQLLVDLYAAPTNGSPSLVLQSTLPISATLYGGGGFGTANFISPNIGGGVYYNGQIKVRDAAFATAELAQAGGGYYGFSQVFVARASSGLAYFNINNTLAANAQSTWAPGTVALGGGQFGAIPISVVPVPEPSSMALAGLGAASLLIFRRRK